MTTQSKADTLKSEAFVNLLERHKGILYKVARSYAGELELDDMIQDICLQLWRSMERYDSQFAESTWVYRIALNTCISAYRKHRQRDKQVIMPFSHFEDKMEDEQIKTLYQSIQRLGEIDRALTLLHLDGKTNKEIAHIMGYTETNVSTRLSRIRIELRNIANTLKK